MLFISRMFWSPDVVILHFDQFKLIFPRHKAPLIDYCFPAWLKDTQMDEISLCTTARDTDRTAASNECSVQGSLRQHKPRAIKDFCASMQNTLASFSKEGKNEGIHQGEDCNMRARGDVIKEKSLTCEKKDTEGMFYSNSFSTGKTPSRKMVYSEPQNTILKLLSARTERKSQAELQENKPTEYQVISTAFWFVSRILCLVFISFSRLLSVVLVKTLISIYPSIYWIKAWHIYFSIISFTYIIPDESLEDLLHNQVLLKRSAPL